MQTEKDKQKDLDGQIRAAIFRASGSIDINPFERNPTAVFTYHLSPNGLEGLVAELKEVYANEFSKMIPERLIIDVQETDVSTRPQTG